MQYVFVPVRFVEDWLAVNKDVTIILSFALCHKSCTVCDCSAEPAAEPASIYRNELKENTITILYIAAVLLLHNVALGQ